MSMQTKQRNAPDITYRCGQPAAIILDIDDYKEVLERLEDVEDLRLLAGMKSKPLEFRKLEDYFEER